MALLEQGKVTRIDTTIDLVNWEPAPTSSGTGTAVDKVFHNGNQIIRATLTRAVPTKGYYEYLYGDPEVDPPDIRYGRNHTELIDGVKSTVSSDGDPSGTGQLLSVMAGFDNTPSPAVSNKCYLYTKLALNAQGGGTPAWTVWKSYVEPDFGADPGAYDGWLGIASFSQITGVTYVETYDNLIDAFRYEFTFPSPQSYNYLRIAKTVNGQTSFINEQITEFQPVAPRTPTIKYWFFGSQVESDGAEGVTKELPEGTLDVCYDAGTEVLYNIRFVDTGGTSVSLDDDFTEIAASTDVSSQRWEENVSSLFQRDIDGDFLKFQPTSGGIGWLTSNFTLTGDFNLSLYYEEVSPINEIASAAGLVVVDANRNQIGGVFIASSGTSSSGTYSAVYFSDIRNNTDGAEITYLFKGNKRIGATSTELPALETWYITHAGSGSWSVSGTVNGVQSSMTTGVSYSNNYFSGQIASNENHAIGESFSFDLVHEYIARTATSGTLYISRSVDAVAMRMDDGGGDTPVSLNSQAETSGVKVYIWGSSSGTDDILFDNFTVVSGTGSYPDVPSFRVEKRNAEGNYISDHITSLDLVNTSNAHYNQYLDGAVAIAHADDKLYIKVNDRLMRFADSGGWPSSDGTTDPTDGHAEVVSVGQIDALNVVNMEVITMNVNPATGADEGPQNVLVYAYNNEGIGQKEIRTVTTSGLQLDTDNRLLVVEDGELTSTSMNFFWNINDRNTMYYVEDDGSLYNYNCDDRLVGFVNVNFGDPNLPAGVGAQTDLLVTVANLWGSPLAGKTVSFAVTVGDASISPTSGESISDGTVEVAGGGAYPQITSGSTVGTATVKATVNQ